jgi:[ribosomal protein S5]-alanine N-acetyltransferase
MREPFLTDRLLLRDITEADADLMFDLDSDPEVMRYIGSRLANDASWYRDLIQMKFVPQQTHSWHGVRVVFDRVSGDFLGSVSIRPATASKDAKALGWSRSDEIEIGFRFRQLVWGRGIATEAAKPLVAIALADPTTTAIVAYAEISNVASLRVLQKLGLEPVGEVLLTGTSEPTVKLARLKEGPANLASKGSGRSSACVSG